MALLICEKCKAIIGPLGAEIDTEEMLCRDCAIKKYGQAYVDNAENMSEDIEEEGDD
jgi:hypothetical protein